MIQREWEAFLTRHDLIWSSKPVSWGEGAFLGNGMMGGEVDKEFHLIIAMSANNSIIEGMIAPLLMSHDKMNSHIKYRERDVTVQFHTDIYHALKDHNPPEAFTHMYRHLSYVRDKLLKHQTE